MPDSEITEVNIPTGIPLVYEFDSEFNVTRKFYIGDEAELARKIEAVANQGSTNKF
jgi:2,3-bisphosphoglycerate-dependent phosphoglycerate mutase